MGAPAARPDTTPSGTGVSAPAGRRGSWWWGLLAVLVVAAGGAFWWKGGGSQAAAPSGQQQAAPRRIPVEAAAVEAVDLPIFLDSLGVVQALQTVVVRSRVEGEIVQLAFTEGQEVRKGDLLAQIDPRPFQAALDQAVAKKAQDEAALSANQLDLQRTQQLASREFATRQSLDQQTAGVEGARALIAMDQAMIDNARTQLDYTAIRAPIDGRLGFRLVDQGNIVRTSDTTGIVEITQVDPISVVFTAPENQLPAIARAKQEGGVKVVAQTSDGKTVLGEGTLSLINNQVDSQTGTIRLRAVFANGDRRLWPGLSVTTRLLAQTIRAATVVPEDAVMRGQDELYVYLVGADDKVEKRVVRIGPYSEGKAVVEAGLGPGDRIVTAGHSRVQPGATVEIAKPRETLAQAGQAASTGAAATAKD